MTNTSTRINVKGRQVEVPLVQIDGFDIVTTGRWLKIAAVESEDYAAKDPSANPERIVGGLKQQSIKPDVFTFAQRLPDKAVRYSYPMRWDNVAAIPLTTFDDWWNVLPQASRKNVRRSQRRGVVVRAAGLDRRMAEGIKAIYDETPIRQGRRFWHYGKDTDTVLKENSTYPDRSEFVAAYLNDELIGFIKLVYAGKIARIMQIICKNRHFDKRPANALVTKAVELCCQKGMSYFVYGKYVYGNQTDSALIEFKRRTGFIRCDLPRYYVPLTSKGALGIRLRLHLGMRELLPPTLEKLLLDVRSKYYARRQPMNSSTDPKEQDGLTSEAVG